MTKKYLSRDEGACVECTACTAQCQRGALSIARPGFTVRLDVSKCTACGRCVDACGYRALGLAAGALEGAGAA
jgi:heterodisulfide reductase subunit A-like polyferredoxin